MKLKAERHQLAEGAGMRMNFTWDAGSSREANHDIWLTKFGQNLPTSAARWTGSLVEVRDGDCGDVQIGAVFGDGADQGRSFGAEGESKAHVFDVSSCHDDAGVQQDCGADAEARVRRVGVERGGSGGFHEPLSLSRERKAFVHCVLTGHGHWIQWWNEIQA